MRRTGPLALIGRNAGFSNPTRTQAFLNILDDAPEDEPIETPLTFVYFVLDAEAAQVKIGITDNIERRLSQLSWARGRQLELLGAMRGGYDLERAMHGRFRPYLREGREWYSTEILGEVAPLLAA